jgi:hypothetical protein
MNLQIQSAVNILIACQLMKKDGSCILDVLYEIVCALCGGNICPSVI